MATESEILKMSMITTINLMNRYLDRVVEFDDLWAMDIFALERLRDELVVDYNKEVKRKGLL